MQKKFLTEEEVFYMKIYLNRKIIRNKITEFGIISKHKPYENQRESILYLLDLMIKKINLRKEYNYNIDEHLMVDSSDIIKIINIIKDAYYNSKDIFFEPGKTNYIFVNMVKEIKTYLQKGFKLKKKDLNLNRNI